MDKNLATQAALGYHASVKFPKNSFGTHMTHIRFYVILLFCVSFIGLNIIETCLYQSWEKAVAEERDHQSKMVYAEHLDLFTDQLLRQTANAALSDPPLMEMLKKQGVTIQPHSSSMNKPSSTDGFAPAANPDPSTSLPDHP